MSGENENLRLLAVFHYVLGGLTALFSLFPALYLLLGVLMLADPMDFSGKGSPPPPEFAGIFLTALGGILALAVLVVAFGLILAGRFIDGRRHHTFCMVVAGLSCMIFPLGTALGVFSLILLMKPEVRMMFDKPRQEGALQSASD
ncbi:YIP1 family protein [Candidatus Fermentibacteria bacterium]|nr:YIP1 family protein [Candidatus Fermentibacteria bacterium]